MTTQSYYLDDLDTANRAIAAIPCMNLSIEAARWRVHHKLNRAIVMICSETEKNNFFAYAGDAVLLKQYAGHPIHTSVFGGQKVDTVVIDAVEAHQTIADLEKVGIDIIFIR